MAAALVPLIAAVLRVFIEPGCQVPLELNRNHKSPCIRSGLSPRKEDQPCHDVIGRALGVYFSMTI